MLFSIVEVLPNEDISICYVASTLYIRFCPVINKIVIIIIIITVNMTITTSATAEVMWPGPFVFHSVYLHVCHAVCVQDYCKSSQPTSLKPDVMTGPTNHKNRLTFSGDPVPDTDSGSLFHFPQHRGTGIFDLLAFLIQSLANFRNTRQNVWHWQDNESTTFWEQSENLDLNPGSLLVQVKCICGGMLSLSAI